MAQSLYELMTGKRQQSPGGNMIMGGGLQLTPDMGMSEFAPDFAMKLAQPKTPDPQQPAPQGSPYRGLPGAPGSFENINAMAQAGPSMKGGASGSGGIMKMFGG